MSREHSTGDRRAEIDRRLDEALDGAAVETDCLAPAQAAAAECDDRWYGRSLVASYEAAADVAEPAPALDAAAAIELLRAYVRLRCELLDRLADEPAGRDPTPALLSSDYLYTSAYSALGDVETARLGACFETVTSVSQTVIETFGAVATGPAPTGADLRAFVDGTAGALGRGAAAIGATLAGVDGRQRSRFETLGRGLGTARRIRLVLDGDADLAPSLSTEVDEGLLRRHAERRLDAIDPSFRELSAVDDAGLLRAFVEASGEMDG